MALVYFSLLCIYCACGCFLNMHAYRPGYHLKKVEDKSDFQGQELEGVLEHFKNDRVKVVEGVVACLQQRYADIDAGVLGASKLADIQSWPSHYEKGII